MFEGLIRIEWGVILSGLLGLLLFALITYAFVWSARIVNAVNLLRQSGKRTEAQIIGHRQERGRTTAYFVTYEFDVDGPHQKARYKREQFVSVRTYRRLIEGSYVTIAYLTDDPSVSRLAGEDEDNWARNNARIWLCLLGLLMFPYSVLVYLLVIFGEPVARHCLNKRKQPNR